MSGKEARKNLEVERKNIIANSIWVQQNKQTATTTTETINLTFFLAARSQCFELECGALSFVEYNQQHVDY